jgi:hypothetical protein
MKYKIYKLEYNDEVIYVGQTKQELKARKKGKYNHIPIQIKKDSLIILIEETDDIGREDYWVNYYKELGCSLYNKNNGNKGYSYNSLEYRLNNKDKILIQQKENRINNKERIKESHRKYYMKNRESRLKWQKEYDNNKIKKQD